MSSLAGKTVFITGASGDVGQACTAVFQQAGAQLMLVDRAAPPEGAPAHSDVAFMQADVTDRAAVQAAFDAAVQRFGQVDAAVLAAGIEGPVALLEELSEDQVDAVLAVNLKGSLFAMQACLAHM